MTIKQRVEKLEAAQGAGEEPERVIVRWPEDPDYRPGRPAARWPGKQPVKLYWPDGAEVTPP